MEKAASVLGLAESGRLREGSCEVARRLGCSPGAEVRVNYSFKVKGLVPRMSSNLVQILFLLGMDST